jgi:hypothetical protein
MRRFSSPGMSAAQGVRAACDSPPYRRIAIVVPVTGAMMSTLPSYWQVVVVKPPGNVGGVVQVNADGDGATGGGVPGSPRRP